MPPLPATTGFESATLSRPEWLLVVFVALAIGYLVLDSVRSRRHRDRKGRFRSRRRGQFIGLLKIGIVVGLLWLTATVTGFL